MAKLNFGFIVVNGMLAGKHIWAGDRCGANSCAGSNADPVVKLDPSRRVVQSFWAGRILWPHGMDVSVPSATAERNCGSGHTSTPSSLLQGIWTGEPWSAHLGDLAALAVVCLVCTALSARVFRWE